MARAVRSGPLAGDLDIASLLREGRIAIRPLSGIVQNLAILKGLF